MTASRTVTVLTKDHGPVTVSEPVWCIGDHANQQGGYRTDIIHDGRETAAWFRGHEILPVGLVAWPCAERAPKGPFMSVYMGSDHVHCLPADLDELAAVLVEHAATLRRHARELSVLLGAEGGR